MHHQVPFTATHVGNDQSKLCIHPWIKSTHAVFFQRLYAREVNHVCYLCTPKLISHTASNDAHIHTGAMASRPQASLPAPTATPSPSSKPSSTSPTSSKWCSARMCMDRVLLAPRPTTLAQVGLKERLCRSARV